MYLAASWAERMCELAGAEVFISMPPYRFVTAHDCMEIGAPFNTIFFHCNGVALKTRVTA
jgi:hypothetical protein